MINNKIIYTGHKYTEIITKPSDQGTMRNFINADVEMNKLDIEYFLRGCGIGLEVLDD